MAEGIANYYGKGKLIAFSAGANPAGVNPYAIKVMKEIGIDISHQRSKKQMNLQENSLIILLHCAKVLNRNVLFFQVNQSESTGI